MNELVIEELGGNCPVQGEGTVGSRPFYFRARGEHWSFRVVEKGQCPYGMYEKESVFYREEPYGTWPDAGWMELKTARGFIERCAAEYLQELKASKKSKQA